MKRYKAVNFEYDDACGTGIALDIVEHDEGEFVKYDDIKHQLQNTSSNSDYATALKVWDEFGEKADDMLDSQFGYWVTQRLNQQS